MLNLFEYRDYRKFLYDTYQHEKKASQLTLQKFAKKIGMSPSLLKMVMDGQRKLSGDKIPKVASVLNLNHQEWDFFESLVRFGNAEEGEERNFYSRRLDDLDQSSGLSRVRTDKDELISRWYLPALLVFLLDFSKNENGELVYDADRVSAALGLSQREISELIQELIDIGLLQLKSRGNVQIVYGKILGTLRKQMFFEKILGELKEQLNSNFSKKDRVFDISIMSLDLKQLESFKQDYKRLIDTYTASEANSRSRVVQTFLGAFPVI